MKGISNVYKTRAGSLLNSKIAKNFIILLSGGALSQILIFLASPLLTRMYSSKDFGELAGYSSILAIFLVVSSLCYEKAIPLEQDNVLSFYLVLLSISLVMLTSLLNLLIYLITDIRILSFVGLGNDFINYLLLSIGLLGAGIFQVLTYWGIRENEFKKTTVGKITQSISNIVSQILLYLIMGGSKGLIIGDVIGRMFGSTRLMLTLFSKNVEILKNFRFSNILTVCKKYYKFPLYSSISVLFNSAAIQAPILLLTNVYNSQVVGWFSLSNKTIAIPIALIATSLGQVYYSEASKLINKDLSHLKKLYYTTSKKLIYIFFPIFLLFFWISPSMFTFIFGEEWRISGEYAQLLTCMFIAQIAVMPISQTLYILGRQKLQLAWDMSRFFLIVVGIIIIGDLGFEPSIAIGYYSAVMTISYVVLYILGYLCINLQLKK